MGGKLTIAGSHIGTVLGPSVAILWAMLKLSRAMGMLKLYVRCCSDMLLDLCPKVLSPRNTKILSGFWRAMFFPFGGQMQGSKQHFGPRLGPAWALLRYLEATALLLGAKLGDFEGKLGYREVMFTLSRAMLCYVEAICQILFGHVVGFASRNALPPEGPRFSVGFWELCWLHVGSLWPRWPTSVILGLCWCDMVKI